MKKLTISLFAMAISVCVGAQSSLTIGVEPGEKWWGAASDGIGAAMPMRPELPVIDQRTQNFNSKTAPLLVSNHGRYVWADGPMVIGMAGDSIKLSSYRGDIHCGSVGGGNLRDAYLAVSSAHFAPTGQLPPEEFFIVPQYNTWIELLYDQNQADVLAYARNILASGLPAGVLMIDDNWQKDYGDFEFRPDRFPDPKAMTDTLHAMGFKVMLWISPYVSPDSKESRDLAAAGYLLKAKGSSDAAVVSWWNGHSTCYDMSNPDACDYLRAKLNSLQTRYGIDGFKFDGGDPERALEEDVDVADGRSFDTEQSRLWAQFAATFPYNELRACWCEGNQPLVQRLGDKPYSWNGVSQLVPSMVSAGLIGHSFAIPDMIGGGEYGSFTGVGTGDFDPQLIVRSCQIHSMMPMMQFSVAPWRVLPEQYLDICRRYAQWHVYLGPYIMETARHCAATGEPIVRHMAYEFPGEEMEEVTDQYMLGSRYLVAPVTTASARRSVRLPRGKWRDDRGKIWRGGRTVEVDAPVERLPWFERIK